MVASSMIDGEKVSADGDDGGRPFEEIGHESITFEQLKELSLSPAEKKERSRLTGRTRQKAGQIPPTKHSSLGALGQRGLAKRNAQKRRPSLGGNENGQGSSSSLELEGFQAFSASLASLKVSPSKSNIYDQAKAKRSQINSRRELRKGRGRSIARANSTEGLQEAGRLAARARQNNGQSAPKKHSSLGVLGGRGLAKPYSSMGQIGYRSVDSFELEGFTGFTSSLADGDDDSPTTIPNKYIQAKTKRSRGDQRQPRRGRSRSVNDRSPNPKAQHEAGRLAARARQSAGEGSPIKHSSLKTTGTKDLGRLAARARNNGPQKHLSLGVLGRRELSKRNAPNATLEQEGFQGSRASLSAEDAGKPNPYTQSNTRKPQSPSRVSPRRGRSRGDSPMPSDTSAGSPSRIVIDNTIQDAKESVRKRTDDGSASTSKKKQSSSKTKEKKSSKTKSTSSGTKTQTAESHKKKERFSTHSNSEIIEDILGFSGRPEEDTSASKANSKRRVERKSSKKKERKSSRRLLEDSEDKGEENLDGSFRRRASKPERRKSAPDDVSPRIRSKKSAPGRKSEGNGEKNLDSSFRRRTAKPGRRESAPAGSSPRQRKTKKKVSKSSQRKIETEEESGIHIREKNQPF